MKIIGKTAACFLALSVVTAMLSFRWYQVLGEEVWWNRSSGKLSTRLLAFGFHVSERQSDLKKGSLFGTNGIVDDNGWDLIFRRSLVFQPRRSYGISGKLFAFAESFEAMAERDRLSETGRVNALELFRERNLPGLSQLYEAEVLK